MIFISLIKWKPLPTEELITGMNKVTKSIGELEKQGIKVDLYWTLGRYDAVAVGEAPNEKAAMKVLLGFRDIVETETMIAVSREEAIKLF
jgi:uncharacterized protein with GYD domain